MSKLTRKESIRVDKVNSYFLNKVLESKLFTDKLIAFINTHLLKEQKTEINKKLFNLCKKWQSDRIDQTFESYQATVQKIKKDPKFKLPWTIMEVVEGVERFRKNYKIGSWDK